MYLLSGGIEEFVEAHPSYVTGKKVPLIDPKKFMKKQISAKIEVRRQPVEKPMSKATGTRLPPIKKNSFGDSQGKFRYDAANKRSGSAAMQRRNKTDIFNVKRKKT